jgi:heme A synthase
MGTVTGTPQPGNPSAAGGSGSPRSIWTAVFLVFAVIVGAAAGLLKYASDASVSSALLYGGGAFAATVTLLVLVYRFATDKSI